MRLAIIDGTNAVMRRVMVQKDDLSRDRVALGTLLNILDFVRWSKATHLLVAFDSTTSTRREHCSAYKADRTVNTGPYAGALLKACAERGIACVGAKGCEADDVIATLVARVQGRCDVLTLSSDNDLLVLAEEGEHWVRCAQYKKGGGFEVLSMEQVITKLPVEPHLMPAYQALVGGKNGAPGVPGIGKKGAIELLDRYPNEWLPCVAEEFQEVTKLWAEELLPLDKYADVPPIEPSYCAITKIHAEVTGGR